MKFFTTLVTLAMVCIHQALANTVNYLIWDPNANVTRFEATMIVPPTTNAASSGSSKVLQKLYGGGLISSGDIWANEITNQYGTGTWNFQSILDSQGVDSAMDGNTRIYPAQEMTSVFAKDLTNGYFIDGWVVGSGLAPNVQSFAGSFTENPAQSKKNDAYIGAFVGAAFEGVTNGPSAVWTLGTVKYQNIIIVAETTSTSWCTPDAGSWKNVTWSSPVATVDGAYTTCYLACITMTGP